ncbi:DNA mismatch endonuclease Vsr [Sinorhizobium meliloti]|uniref:very short patch repair endonuclease n=1 Tax=Rhizobium meliloti TaxID=382 RepID=UPI000FDCD089|nr:very short patch repair endonuclease [Sinorhizobium meliloti]MDW9896303.1 DNA mismatch endonuclease Vsr [Sinorhizobium meliloti]RVQ54226.1 DNA mismatch endonuclease Vsr [Sinorhizobium meliloti]
MTDTRSAEQRRRIMQSVKTKNTGPERVVRKALFALGYRFRLHRKELPGSPDIVFPSRKKAIFIHGCFWHGHDCSKGRGSKSRTEYWGPKVETNRARDERNIRDLAERGWQTHVVWQCELKDMDDLLKRLGNFLGPPLNSIHNARTRL